MSSAKIRRLALRELEDKQGRVTPDLLVQAAKNPRHPLHKDFVWDDSRAAHRYRLDQARAIISSVRVTTVIGKQKYSSVGYVRDPAAAPAQGYRNISKIKTDEQSAYETLMEEIRRVEAILTRCIEISAVLGLDEELRNSLDLLKAFRKQAKPRIRGRNDEDRPNA